MSQYVSVELRRRVREAYDECCAYCQTREALAVSTFEMEHIFPTSRGGKTAFENLCLACPACNRFKSDRTHVIFDDGVKVRLFHPQHGRWSDHFDWSVDGTVIVGLTKIAMATTELLRLNRERLVEVRALWVDAGRHPPY